MISPFCSSAGGGDHETEKDVVEVLVIMMLVGGAPGAVCEQRICCQAIILAIPYRYHCNASDNFSKHLRASGIWSSLNVEKGPIATVKAATDTW